MLSKCKKEVLVRALGVGLTAAVMATGSVVAAFRADAARAGYAILWPVIPMTLMLCLVAAVNALALTPRFLRRGRLAAYAILLFVTVYTAVNLTFALEYHIREAMQLPHRISDYLSPWILVDSLSSTVLVMILMGGYSLIGIYTEWKRQSRQLDALHSRLDRNVALMKEMLDARRIFASLDRITALATTDPGRANSEIMELSGHLRHQLYDTPAFQRPLADDAPDAVAPPAPSGRLKDFIAAPRYRAARHLLFQLALAVIALGSLFDTPDRPVLTPGSVAAVVSLYAFLNLLAWVNIRWLYPRFLNRHRSRRYVVVAVAVTAALAAGSIPLQLATYSPSVYNHDLPLVLTSLSALSSMVTILIFLFGTASIIYLQRWIRGTYEMAELQAQTAVSEMDYLKKQINPHFLFNVLNNTGIMIYEDTSVALRMLAQLRMLLRYQLEESRRVFTTFGAEAAFLRSYLQLQQSRRSHFTFTLDAPAGCENLRIPVLMYIPFVENAVKYSIEHDGVSRIDVSFTLDGGILTFRCLNGCECGESASPAGSGGIGLTNTRRRLQLIYGDRFSLTHGRIKSPDSHCLYLVELRLPPFPIRPNQDKSR